MLTYGPDNRKPRGKVRENRRAQRKNECYNCGAQDHMVQECTQHKAPCKYNKCKGIGHGHKCPKQEYEVKSKLARKVHKRLETKIAKKGRYPS